MAKKATYKVFNGNSFEDIYFKTSIEQVEGLQDALSNLENHTHSGTYEPVFTKNTAFNKNFGKTAGTVAQGDDSRFTNARTPLSHTHGSITNDGALDSNVTIASGDHLVIADHSQSNKLKTSSIIFGTGTTTYLRNNGTWGAPTIPSIPSVMTTNEGNLGTATTQRTINAKNLKEIILNHSPAVHSHTISEVEGLQDALSSISSNATPFLWNYKEEINIPYGEIEIADLPAPYNTILGEYIFGSEQEAAYVTPEIDGIYALVTGVKWSPASSSEYNNARHQINKRVNLDVSRFTESDVNRLVVPTFHLMDYGQDSVGLRAYDDYGSSYWKLTRADGTIGSSPKVYESIVRSTINNEGTVTKVSAGTQISGMSMRVDNETTTPTIITSISNKTNFRNAIGAGTSNFSGSYNNLTNKPSIPTKTSDLTNNSDFTTQAYVDNKTNAISSELDNTVKLTGDQVIEDRKTFTDLVVGATASSSDMWSIDTPSANHLHFTNTDGINVMTLRKDGRVGINKEPGNGVALDVEGQLQVSGDVRLQGTNLFVKNTTNIRPHSETGSGTRRLNIYKNEDYSMEVNIGPGVSITNDGMTVSTHVESPVYKMGGAQMEYDSTSKSIKFTFG